MVKRKLNGSVDKYSADQEIRKFNTTVHNLYKSGGLHLAEPGLTAGRPSMRQAKLFRRGLKF